MQPGDLPPFGVDELVHRPKWMAEAACTGEPHETFFLDVTHADHAQIQDGRGQGTIFDNDPNGPPPPPEPTLPPCLSARPRC